MVVEALRSALSPKRLDQQVGFVPNRYGYTLESFSIPLASRDLLSRWSSSDVLFDGKIFKAAIEKSHQFDCFQTLVVLFRYNIHKIEMYYARNLSNAER